MPVPSVTKDFVEMIEMRLPGGRSIAKVVLALAVLALAGVFVYVTLTAGRAVMSFLPTSVPIPLEPRDVFSLVLVVLLFAAGFVAIGKRVKRLEGANALNRQVMVAEAETHTDTMKRVERLEARVDYMENKVGGELHDLLVRRVLEGKAWIVEDGTGEMIPNPNMSLGKERT